MNNLNKVRDSISELAVTVMDAYKNRRLQLYKHSSVEIAGKPEGLTSLYMRAGWYHVGGTHSLAIVISSVAIESNFQHKGTFDIILASTIEIAKANQYEFVVVENCVNPEFALALERRGFERNSAICPSLSMKL